MAANPMSVTIHGAGRTVTGSCYELAFAGQRLLVDCGMFQGSRTLEALNREPFAFDPAKIGAVLLTHAHLDHCGLLPRLVAKRFGGAVWCTPATRDLLSIMLPDAARIQEQDAGRRNRRGDRADEPPIEPLYTEEDARRLMELVREVDLGETFEPAPGCEARLWNAGHILGSASIEVGVAGTRILFSGDLGPDQKSFEATPQGPTGIDHLFCESTYGDRARVQETLGERRATLRDEVEAALARGGNLVVPVFALERTQELLLDLALLMNGGSLKRVQVFVDSPLASRATEVFRRHQGDLEDLGDGEVFRHPAFHFTETVDESIRLNSVSGAIILAASGMCEGGRIRHHLLHNLPRWDSTILFVGYQAKGSLGRAILDGAHRVRISGRDVAVRAEVRRIDTYSAHADRHELAAWARARRPVAGSLFLTHGEEEAMATLQNDLAADFASILLPEIGECYALEAAKPARRLRSGRIELRRAIGGDWQNDYADFAVNLKRALQRIESVEARREALRQMRGVIDGLVDHPAGSVGRPEDRAPGTQRRS